MAIQFARIEIVSRSSGGNACLKAAYNARLIIKDERTNVTYNFSKKGDNVYHAVLLPNYVDKRFKDPRVLMNEVERLETRKNSQLLKDIVIALPDDKELDLNDRIAITHEIIEEMGWVKNGLGVQIDIHQPHDGDKNWHAHLLVTTRRFTEDGKSLGAKAVDLNPKFAKVKGKAFIIPEEEIIHKRVKEVINKYFAKLGLEIQVDPISFMPQQHVGPTRMRSIINEIAEQNKICKLAHLEIIKNSDGVLNRIIRHQAIFTKLDIEKAIKEIPEEVEKSKLIREVLNSDRLVKLYNEDGTDTKYYTTKDIRDEELRLLRIAYKVNNQIHFNNIIKLKSAIDNLASVNEAQRESLQHILINNQGIRILQGRAGTGKSQVLVQAYKIATNHGQNIIGLSPTHKAASELKSKGYRQCYTVKGFLFKLYNGKADLPRNSLLVVDEAGMVGNSDYLELLKVARSNNCNLILAGDERQLTSVERGGMFAVLASKFGSYELSRIRRQSKAWAREMASCFARSDITGGLRLLAQHDGLKIDHTLEESMARLINDWSNSKFALNERLIITMRNAEVDSINQGIRELLKARGLLTGKEYRRYLSSEKHEDYMAGDRILFKSTNKDLQIENGEFATITSVSNDKFIAKTDSGKEIEFNPQDVSFKHGYASTVYKAQGASIKNVYVLHNLAGNSRNSYVAMTRHIEEVKLYYNKDSTRNIASLISQLSKIDNRLSSINFKTLEELVAIQDQENKSPNIIDKVGNWFKGIVEDIKDRLHSNDNYYQPKVKSEPPAKVLEILRSTSSNFATSHKAQEEQKSSSYNLTNCNKQDTTISVKLQEDIMVKKKIDYNSVNKQEAVELKQRLSFKAEEIGRNLLGSPNKHLSNSQLLRWEKDGKIVMKIHGSKAGRWYDFSKGEGGDLFTLVQREKNCDFVEAKKYLQDMVGMSTNGGKDLAANLAADKNQQIKTQTEQYAEIAKIKRAIGLYEKSDSIKYVMPNNVAKRYLSEHRGIKEVLTRYQLSNDLRTNMMWDSNSKQYYPALIAFVRNKDGNITGGQAIYLNKETGAKASIEVNKRSFGRIRGSFVEINKNNEQQNVQSRNVQSSKDGNNSVSNITIIAEGVETALSIGEAGIKGKILCSLGVNNIRNYEPIKGERIIIAADNDGKDAVSVRTIIKAQDELISKGAAVAIIRPLETGDFNDVLKSQGAESIRNLLEPEIAKLTVASNVAELKSSLKASDDRKSQFQSIELLFSKMVNNDNNGLNNLQQQQIQALAKFGTAENINTAIQIYREKGIDSCLLYSNKICIAAIEQKIQKDLQIMKNKFNPNYNLGDKKFSDIVVYDFQGKSHLVPEDYLNAIGRDKQVMQYVSPSSEIGKEIRSAVKQVSEIKLNQGIRV
ncbi:MULTISPECIES: AAA family ATPase [Rickettsia]|uniref:Conjugal transfer relaxase TraA n=5 Tax=Rickettsia TaxID=780 RepID=A0A8E1BZW2_9RICK|nr:MULTISPECIES: AAA family ATPase [Rickettsia]ARD86390.1 conjugal transfer protein TraA [Rickettsia bellii]KDO02630.1 conjugal transfer relaxase TraA [Rickettsia tamurae subsp. buchneri]KJV62533.1 AAA domain protein [Rickettsia amblyommatis str. Ac/Pa]KJV90023.1 AAA domain protein [Rickettsia bellii str. RML An4]KJV92167.1 AAA domain protein [Rickettsia bellii str. RML Mogi]